MVAAAVGGAALVGGIYSANAQSKAIRSAADTQSSAALAGIDQQNQRFAAVQKLLEPYANAGVSALNDQQALIGQSGSDAQQAAIAKLQQSPYFTSMLKQGENSIIANASATGNLRGGNTQAALAQYSPTLLAQTINDQYNKLGGLISVGQNAAAGTGNAGMSTGAGISNLLQQQGAALAGGELGAAKANIQMFSSPFQALGAYYGMKGLSSLGATSGASAVGNAGYGDYKAFLDAGSNLF